MPTIEEIQGKIKELKKLGLTTLSLKKGEILELPNILQEDENIEQISGSAYDVYPFSIFCATNKRLLFIHKGRKETTIKSFPYKNIKSITCKTGPFFGELTISTIGEEITVNSIGKSCAKKILSYAQEKMEETTSSPSPLSTKEYTKKINQEIIAEHQNKEASEPKKKKGKGCSRIILLAIIIIVGLIFLGKFGEKKDAPQKVDADSPTITQSEQVEQKPEEGPPPPKETAEPTTTTSFTLTTPSTPSPTTPTQKPDASDSNSHTASESFPVYRSSSTPPTMTPSHYGATDARQEEISMIVYVTQSGNKYHRDGCSYLRKSKIPIDLKDAIRRGYEPCSRCNPPR